MAETKAQVAKRKAFHPDWRFQEPVDWRDTDLDEQTLLEWFHLMLLGRQIDYRCQVLNRQGRAPFIISVAGHEAAQVGVSWPLRPKYDWIAPYYRDIVLCFRMGLTPLDLMLSVLAKPDDPASGGKQTPGHFSDTRLNIVSGGSPLSTQMVHAAGVAYALKMDRTDKVVMTCYGEGAGSEGDAHEAFNFAAIYRLPMVFVCQNNGFAISVPFDKQYAIEHAAQRSAGYGFPGVTVDGRDPVTCYHVGKQAVARARAGDGPTLIECLVDRLGAHSSEDDQRRYRSQEELDQLAANDGLARFRTRLLEEGLLDEKTADEYDEQVKDEVTRATRQGLDAADARPEDALTNVYSVDLPAAFVPGSPAETEDMNMVQAVRDALAQEMERNERVIVLGEDVGPKGGVFLVTDGLYARFGAERVIDTPIAESSIAGIALGLSLAGKRPVAEMQFTDFAHMAFNQITNEIAKFRYRTNGDWGAPLVIRAPMGGHSHGALYHSQSIEARFATPGLKIVVPSTPYEAKGLLIASIECDDPVIFLEPKRIYNGPFDGHHERPLVSWSGHPLADVPEPHYTVPLESAAVIREGGAVTVLAYGTMVWVAQAAVNESGVDGEIIDLRSLWPLDLDTMIGSVKKTGRCVIVHEATRSSGFGAELAALVQEHCFFHLEAPIERVTGWDTPYPHAQEWAYFPGPDRVGKALKRVMET